METVYHFLDYFKNVWSSCKVEILSETEKTCKVKLLGFGPNGSAPGTIFSKVHKTSLDAYKHLKKNSPIKPNKNWGTYNYV